MTQGLHPLSTDIIALIKALAYRELLKRAKLLVYVCSLEPNSHRAPLNPICLAASRGRVLLRTQLIE
jgi:hypothetical protein